MVSDDKTERQIAKLTLDRPAPIVIGVAGGSGSGKTTVVRRIVQSIGADQVTVLEHDRYYRERPDLRLEERAPLTYVLPVPLGTDRRGGHVLARRAGEAVDVPRYDFARYARHRTTETFRRAARSSSKGS